MAKDAFYFSHDYNARSDQKISKLLAKHGMLGYGLYWAIIEILYNNNNILEIDYDCLSYDLRSDSEIIKSVINDFGLFTFCENTFGSISVERRLNERAKKTKKAEDSANARWSKDEKDEERKKAVQCLLYAIKIYDESETFIKVGITTESVSRRYSGKLNDYQYEMIFSCENTVEKCLEYERTIKNIFKNYTPQKQFAGYLECLEISQYDELINFVMQDKMFRNANIKFRNAIKERKGKEIKESKQITYNKVVDEILISLKDLFDEKYLTSDKTKVMFNKLLKKYSKDEILKATIWARNDNFWKSNFCSPLKLEKKNKEDVVYIDVFLEKAGNYKMPTTEPTKTALPYEGFNPLSIDLSKLKPLR